MMQLHTLLILWVLMVGSGFMIGFGVGRITSDTPTIGGTNVPLSLDCEEDEVIGFTDIDTLDCIEDTPRIQGNSQCVKFYKDTIAEHDLDITLGSKVRYCHTLGGT